MSAIILATHRSGSSFVNQIVRHHPIVESINEPFSQHLDLFRKTELVRHWSADEFHPHYLHSDLSSYPSTIEYLIEFQRWFSSGDEYLVTSFKETGLFGKLSWVLAFLKEASIILLVRDPRAVIASNLKRNMHNSWWAYSRRLQQINTQSMSLGWEEDFADDDPAAVTAGIWSYSYRLALSELRDRPWFLLRLEDLLDEPELWIDRLMKFIGLRAVDSQLEFVRASWKESRANAYSYQRTKSEVTDTWRGVLNDDSVRRIERIARSEMEVFNYV